MTRGAKALLATLLIVSLRKQNERLSIRVDAIDDMLSLLNGRPGNKSGGEMSPDIVYEIDKALAQ